MTLDDGTVLPSFQRIQTPPHQGNGAGALLNDTTLRVGEVVARYDPSDSANVSKIEAEYLVMVNHRDGVGVMTTTPYHCWVSDGFGSQGDYSRHSLRVKDDTDPAKDPHNGAIVLISCINGSKSQAIIIKSLRHPLHKDPDPSGRFLGFSFNGVKAAINDAGDLTLSVVGPTVNDGTLDPNAPANVKSDSGSFVVVGADGVITISDASTDDQIIVNPRNKTININSQVMAAKAQSSWTVDCPDIELGASSGPQVNIYDSGVELGGSNTSPPIDFVALATNTEARLAALELFAMTHIHTVAAFGPSTPAPGAPVSTGPVAATKVKAI